MSGDRASDESPMRSGFVTLVGRPNVGKSTLLNAICGRKISIVSDKPQTTRRQIRGVLTRPGSQIVFVDTPGLHKPVTALGVRVNAAAIESLDDVDVSCLVVDGTMPFGSGDRWVAERLDMSRTVVIINKSDITSREKLLKQLAAAAELERGLIGERTSAAMRQRLNEGRYIGGRAPYGLQNVDGALVPVESEQRTIALARELRSEGRTLRAVAAELETRGILSRTGRTFAAQDIQRMVAA
jgi:small GTP-binding protein